MNIGDKKIKKAKSTILALGCSQTLGSNTVLIPKGCQGLCEPEIDVPKGFD